MPLLSPACCFPTTAAACLPAAAAFGAVFIAAVGVWGVFKMAFYVASETGRTLNADKSEAASSSGGAAASAAPDVKAASPLEQPHAALPLGCGFAAAACSSDGDRSSSIESGAGAWRWR